MGFNASFLHLQETFHAKYPKIRVDRLEMELKRIQVIASKAKDLVGKRVIDLGAGSMKNLDRDFIAAIVRFLMGGGTQSPFQPWYSRILQHAGAHPVAIDIAPNDTEKFESHRLDLTDPAALDVFEKNSFDAANNFGFTVPQHSAISWRGVPPSLLYNFGLSRAEVLELDAELREKVRQLLKENGTYTLAEFVYRKKSGKLLQERRIYQE